MGAVPIQLHSITSNPYLGASGEMAVLRVSNLGEKIPQLLVP